MTFLKTCTHLHSVLSMYFSITVNVEHGLKLYVLPDVKKRSFPIQKLEANLYGYGRCSVYLAEPVWWQRCCFSCEICTASVTSVSRFGSSDSSLLNVGSIVA